MQMKSKMKLSLIILLVVLQFLTMIFLVIRNEAQLKSGKEIVLELTPVDPRSLLQGDYVTLNYKISSPRDQNLSAKNGHVKVILTKSADNVYIFKSFYDRDAKTDLRGSDVIINGKIKSGRILYGIENFFVEEDTGLMVERSAKYARVNLSSNGNAMIVGLMSEP